MDIVGTITAPARLGYRVASWGVRTAVGLLPFGGDDEPDARPAPPGPTVEERPDPAATVVRPTPAPEPAAEPRHVDEGATVVAEFAEEGAEEGAGAEVHQSEPWDGYDRLYADDVIDRLSGASDETLAAVILYERFTRARPSVLDAAEEQLRRRGAPGRT